MLMGVKSKAFGKGLLYTLGLIHLFPSSLNAIQNYETDFKFPENRVIKK